MKKAVDNSKFDFKKLSLLFLVVSEIRRVKPTVLIATPGRLLDLIYNFNLSVENSSYQILDEGDKMLDMGFDKDIERLQENMPNA